MGLIVDKKTKLCIGDTDKLDMKLINYIENALYDNIKRTNPNYDNGNCYQLSLLNYFKLKNCGAKRCSGSVKTGLYNCYEIDGKIFGTPNTGPYTKHMWIECKDKVFTSAKDVETLKEKVFCMDIELFYTCNQPKDVKIFTDKENTNELLDYLEDYLVKNNL